MGSALDADETVAVVELGESDWGLPLIAADRASKHVMQFFCGDHFTAINGEARSALGSAWPIARSAR